MFLMFKRIKSCTLQIKLLTKTRSNTCNYLGSTDHLRKSDVPVGPMIQCFLTVNLMLFFDLNIYLFNVF